MNHPGLRMPAAALRQASIDARPVNGYYSHMKRASITEAKNGLSALIDRVRHGDAIVIEDRGVPVARLEPIAAPGSGGAQGRAARLVRQGVLRPAAGSMPKLVLATAPPAPTGPSKPSRLLIDERRSGR
jgi:prevent-host-death family protein